MLQEELLLSCPGFHLGNTQAGKMAWNRPAPSHSLFYSGGPNHKPCLYHSRIACFHMFIFKASIKFQHGTLQNTCTSGTKISHGSSVAPSKPGSEKPATAFGETDVEQPAALLPTSPKNAKTDTSQPQCMCTEQAEWLTELPKAGKENFMLYKVCHFHSA